MMTERKMFTAELQRLRAQGNSPAVMGSGHPGNAEVLDAINALRAEIKELREAGARQQELEELQQSADDVMNQRQAEVTMLKTELRALAVCIEQTKQEIASLRPHNADDDRIMAVTFELDAIVSSTENATQTILESAEKIDGIAREIQSLGVEPYVARLAEDIGESVVNVFEACNFQDITGQRITKVVKTLQYIESKINNMIEIWGPENIAEVVPKPKTDDREGDAKLLNGPALENQGISQSEIDALFG